ncbi:MAG: hypothetical protein H7138_27445, partial [Myxococcales bacterium]|nr:hypothetical protein [Myxococcales bacterium]
DFGGNGLQGAGGGGAAGYIVIRSRDVTMKGLVSPVPMMLDLPPMP